MVVFLHHCCDFVWTGLMLVKRTLWVSKRSKIRVKSLGSSGSEFSVYKMYQKLSRIFMAKIQKLVWDLISAVYAYFRTCARTHTSHNITRPTPTLTSPIPISCLVSDSEGTCFGSLVQVQVQTSKPTLQRQQRRTLVCKCKNEVSTY